MLTAPDGTWPRCGHPRRRRNRGTGFCGSLGMCEACYARQRRAPAPTPQPRLVSGSYGYSPRLGTARGVAA